MHPFHTLSYFKLNKKEMNRKETLAVEFKRGWEQGEGLGGKYTCVNCQMIPKYGKAQMWTPEFFPL